MLNSNAKKSIIDSLNYKGYSQSDFIVREQDDYDHTQIAIKLSYSPGSQAIIRIPSDDTNSCKMSYSPGNVLQEESDADISFSRLPSMIKKWLDIVTRELLTTPEIKHINHRLAEQEKLAVEIIEKIDAMDDDVFSDEELTEIKDKLEKIEVQINEELEKLKEEKNALYDEMKKMQSELSLLQRTLDVSDKKAWMKTFAIKILNWYSKPQNKQIVSASIGLAKSALPPNVQEIVDMTNISSGE